MVEKVTICKVLYDFDSAEPGEISLKEGQYIQLIGQVGKQTDGVFCTAFCHSILYMLIGMT